MMLKLKKKKKILPKKSYFSRRCRYWEVFVSNKFPLLKKTINILLVTYMMITKMITTTYNACDCSEDSDKE